MEVLVRFCVPPSDVIKAPPWPLPPDPPTPPDAGPAGPADCLIVDQQAIVEVERAKQCANGPALAAAAGTAIDAGAAGPTVVQDVEEHEPHRAPA